VKHGDKNKKEGYPEGYIYEQFAYRSSPVAYLNSSGMNELVAMLKIKKRRQKL